MLQPGKELGQCACKSSAQSNALVCPHFHDSLQNGGGPRRGALFAPHVVLPPRDVFECPGPEVASLAVQWYVTTSPRDIAFIAFDTAAEKGYASWSVPPTLTVDQLSAK